MTETKSSRIKKKIKHYTPEIVTALTIVAGIAVAVYVKTKTPTSTQTEPDRLARPSMIVLENVMKNQNLWRDMDEPDNLYKLNPA